MKESHDLLCPKHCFCHFHEDELLPWVKERYHENKDTVDLIRSARTSHEKELISIVGLLDVDDELLLKAMCNVNKEEYHIVHCREMVKRILGLA